jgi:hypothetical protein
LTSLSGLKNLTSVGGDLLISFNVFLTNLCALYNVGLYGGYLAIYANEYLSMATANALETQLRANGFTGIADIRNNTGLIQVFCDNDNDMVYDNIDNCPKTWNPEQYDPDSDGKGEACDNCPYICNTNQLDADNDTTGDVCDDAPGCGGCGETTCEMSCDFDYDGIQNFEDNCPLRCNELQLDADGDGEGDVCDDTPGCGELGQSACEEECRIP